MHNEKYAIWPIFMDESPQFLHLIGNRGRRTRRWRQILTESRNKTNLRMCNEKYAIWPLVIAESPKLLHSSAMDLWTRLWGRYHVPQNVFLVLYLTVLVYVESNVVLHAVFEILDVKTESISISTAPRHCINHIKHCSHNITNMIFLKDLIKQ